MIAERTLTDSIHHILIECRMPLLNGADAFSESTARQHADSLGFPFDKLFDPVPVHPSGTTKPLSNEDRASFVHYVIRASLTPDDIESISKHKEIVAVWSDPSIEPMTWCSDTGSATHVGNIDEVQRRLGVEHIWNNGYRGEGIAVGVVDGGITAFGRGGRAPSLGERIPGVTNGWPGDWGTAVYWNNEHGNGMAGLVRAIAPNCELYDLRIATGHAFDLSVLNEVQRDFDARLSNAVSAYEWAIRQYRLYGRPQILTNSWGIYRRIWAPDYAQEMRHPFMRKVEEAINLGIVVLFCAGNCGAECADGRCFADPLARRDGDIGPGQSIWGANALENVITVGSMTHLNERIGNSSQGPAYLIDPSSEDAVISVNKPDFCCYSAFRGGYYTTLVNTGTSSATALTAGVLALLKQAFPGKNGNTLKSILARTANPGSWNPDTGCGVIRADWAFYQLYSEVYA